MTEESQEKKRNVVYDFGENPWELLPWDPYNKNTGYDPLDTPLPPSPPSEEARDAEGYTLAERLIRNQEEMQREHAFGWVKPHYPPPRPKTSPPPPPTSVRAPPPPPLPPQKRQREEGRSNEEILARLTQKKLLQQWAAADAEQRRIQDQYRQLLAEAEENKARLARYEKEMKEAKLTFASQSKINSDREKRLRAAEQEAQHTKRPKN